jgi:hypothetical protein
VIREVDVSIGRHDVHHAILQWLTIVHRANGQFRPSRQDFLEVAQPRGVEVLGV